jgi:hypothetical protein
LPWLGEINMREPREPIFELEQKVRFLLENPVVQERCGHNSSVNSFCRKTGVSRSVLRAVTEKHENKMSPLAQTGLARACNFRVDWEEWNDPHANGQTLHEKRKDTAERFRQRYLQENRSQSKGEPAAPRRTGVRLMATRPYAPQAYDQHLASIELQASQSGPGEPWPISVELICWDAPVEWVVIAVKRGRLYMDCGNAHADPNGQPAEADYSRAACKITIRRTRPSPQPSWEIIADPGPIGMLSLPHDFCLVHKLAAGDILAASFRVYIKDLDLVEPPQPPDGEDTPPQEDSFSFMRPGLGKLGRAKQTILKQLAALNLTEGPSGWVELCSDALQFKEIGNAGDEGE